MDNGIGWDGMEEVKNRRNARVGSLLLVQDA